MILHTVFVHFENLRGDLVNVRIFAKKPRRRIDDDILNHLFLDCARRTLFLPPSTGETIVIIVGSASFRTSTDAGHSPFAVTAKQFSRKDEVANLFLAAGSKLVFLVYCANGSP